MANVMALQEAQFNPRTNIFIHKVTLSGSYVQAVEGSNVGELLTPNNASNPNFLPKPMAAHYKRGYVINGPGGFGAEVLKGADDAHWLLKIFGTTPGTELAAGTYAANAPGAPGDIDFLVGFEARSID